MSVRRVRMANPFSGGMVTDVPAYQIGPTNSAFAQDLIAPEGVARQRKGWAFDGTTADLVNKLGGIFRNKFLLADVTRTLTTTTATFEIYIHNPTTFGTLIASTGVAYTPRAVYHDEVLFCAEDGISPMLRYAGAATERTVSGTFTFTDGQATASGGTFSGAVGIGSFIRMRDRNLNLSLKVQDVTSTSSITLEGIVSRDTQAVDIIKSYNTGYGFPAVLVYNAGTVTASAGTVTGYGTRWVSSLDIDPTDAVMILPTGADAEMSSITDSGGTGNTTIETALANQATKSSYAITRPLPFTDVAAHKGSLWGTGVAQFPNNAYVGPPGWNIAFPPGFPLPFDADMPAAVSSANANDFLMDFIAVPSAYDGDVNVAILSSPNPLLVLKRSAIYGITGSFPNFSTDKIVDNIGCIDKRSAISGPNGQFWAGEEGIYAYVGGQVIDLTNGKINREWRALTRSFDYGVLDYCAIGEVYDHLFVSMVTGAGTTTRTYVYDLRNQAWQSRFTNHKARAFFSSRVDGEAQKLYWVGDNDLGRVIESSVCLNATGIAKDGDGDSPRMQAWSSEGIDGDGSIDTDTRMLDLAISANVYDAGAAGSTKMGVSVVSGGSLEAQASSTKTLTAINSDTVDRVDRKRFREVNKKGRLQQVRVDVSTLGTNTAATKVEISEIDASYRGRRDRT